MKCSAKYVWEALLYHLRQKCPVSQSLQVYKARGVCALENSNFLLQSIFFLVGWSNVLVKKSEQQQINLDWPYKILSVL